ncbi:UDP-N-acetylmuramoyl-L-alanyl-D-glutamate--2,6-diaminopimelate ligase [Candidatus Nomurabacteria bacterium]|nr:UDP-N-acetylmuramoyl-L-alanyl-D-glutamate--2,6-diaminopimelate ligase [Candidatus Nomurabacteria bacterium]
MGSSIKKVNKKIKTIWWRIKSYTAMYYYGQPSKKLKIIGVTGTNGKTTTTTLLYKVATELGYKAGLIGTVENIIAGERMPTTHTTPDSITLTKLLAKMVEKGCEYVFIEVSSHALDQGRVLGLNFVGGVFTNLTHDHLDYHKNFDNYFTAKKKLFQMLPHRAFALTNIDNEYGIKMLEGIKANQFSYGFVGEPDKVHFHGDIKKLDFHGLALSFNDIEIKSKLLGRFNAYNLLAVWSACSLLGYDMKRVNKILENIEPPAGRFQHFTAHNGVLVIVDYAHTPDALEKILKTIHEIKKENSKIISVFGCGGDRDPLKRRIMGKIGMTFSDIAIFTSDNPRNEDPMKIIEMMQGNLNEEEKKKVKIIPDRREAIIESLKIAQSGDVVLCAGKGHETYQEIKGVKYHFNDMEELKKFLD